MLPYWSCCNVVVAAYCAIHIALIWIMPFVTTHLRRHRTSSIKSWFRNALETVSYTQFHSHCVQHSSPVRLCEFQPQPWRVWANMGGWLLLRIRKFFTLFIGPKLTKRNMTVVIYLHTIRAWSSGLVKCDRDKLIFLCYVIAITHNWANQRYWFN